MRKQLLSIMLALCMMLTLLPPAWAAELTRETSEDNYTVSPANVSALQANENFTIENGVLTKYAGSGGDAIIPDGVTSIGQEAFRSCIDLTSVTIPDSVTSIGSYAFYGCSSLTSVIIPDSVTSIGGFAFSGCSGLTSISIPANVTDIGGYAFENCNNLTSAGPIGGGYDYEFGWTKEIPACAFFLCEGLTSINIPDSVTNIGRFAFNRCSNLVSVQIPNNVTCIEYAAFGNCSRLTNLTIPNSVITIEGSAFSECSDLININIPSSITRIENNTFFNCSNLTNITIPDNVISIGKSAFSSCWRLKEVDIPNSVVNIEDYAFAYCSSLTNVTIPDSVTQIGWYAFENCSSLTNINLSNSITRISDYTFADCSCLTTVYIPHGVSTISEAAFYDCSNLTSITIPDSVTDIRFRAFGYCKKLTDVYYDGSETDWASILIGKDNTNLTSATIHYNSDIPIGPGDNDRDVHFRQEVYPVHIGEQVLVQAYIRSNAGQLPNDYVTWSSSDERVATVEPSNVMGTSAYAEVRGNSYGTATITVTTTDGKSASCEVTVTEKPNEMSIEAPSAMLVSSNQEISANLTVFTVYSNEGFEWTTDNPDVIAFDENGLGSVIHALGSNWQVQENIQDSIKIYARSTGRTTITCSSESGAVAKCEIVVCTAEGLKLQQLAANWVDSYNKYIEKVDGVLKEGTAQLNIEKEELTKEMKDQNLVIFTDKGPLDTDEKVLNIYRAIVDALNLDEKFIVSFDKIDISDDEDKMAREVAGYVLDLIDKYNLKDEIFHYGNSRVKLNGLGILSIQYKEADGPWVSVGTFVPSNSSLQDIAKVCVSNLTNLGNNIVRAAEKTLVKDVWLEPLDKLAKKGITAVLDKHLDAFKKTGVGRVSNVVAKCIDYYEYVGKIISFADSDLSSISAFVNEMENMDFSPNDDALKNVAVENAIKLLNQSAEALYNAAKLYIDNKPINDSVISSIFQHKSSGVKSTIQGSVAGIAVYGTDGSQIGYVGDNELWYDEDHLYITYQGGTKVFYSYDGAVRFDMVGASNGTLNCTFEEYNHDSPVKRVNYYNIPLTEGTDVQASVPQSNLNTGNIIVTVGSASISANEQISAGDYGNSTVFVNCRADDSKAGKVFGMGNYVRGDTVSLFAMEEDGYSLTGWFNESNELVTTSNVCELIAAEDITLTARFAESVYEEPFDDTFLIFPDANGGTVNVIALKTNSIGKLQSLPTPVREGYTFKGWYTELEGGSLVTLNTVFTSNTVIYALWIDNQNGNTNPSDDIEQSGERSSSSGRRSKQTNERNNESVSEIAISRAAGGTVTAEPSSAAEGATVTLYVRPDNGYELDILSVTTAGGSSVNLTAAGTGEYIFLMPNEKVTVSAVFKESQASAINFIDVQQNAYYYNAVQWAAAQGITSGTTPTTFSPDSVCTRAEAVTFLWRANGSPSPTGSVNPFSDVTSGEYYYDAVLWAVENGIVSGTSATKFSPNVIVTRGQTVSFQYRAVGSPMVSKNLPFSDVSDDAYYANAVKWAVSEGVTNGTSATEFSPDRSCTRAQIVTFLYNAKAN